MNSTLLYILAPLFVVMGLLSTLYLFLSKKFNILTTISKPLPILILFLLIVAIGDSSPLLSVNVGKYGSILVMSFLAGILGILFYYRFKISDIKNGFKEDLPKSLFIPLTLFLISNIVN